MHFKRHNFDIIGKKILSLLKVYVPIDGDLVLVHVRDGAGVGGRGHVKDRDRHANLGRPLLVAHCHLCTRRVYAI